jgi:ankyrin repeat protein
MKYTMLVPTLMACIVGSGLAAGELHEAVKNQPTHQVLAILDRTPGLDLQDEQGNSALMLAAEGGRLDLVQALLAKGANVSARRCFVWVTGGIGRPGFQHRAEGFGARESLSA